MTALKLYPRPLPSFDPDQSKQDYPSGFHFVLKLGEFPYSGTSFAAVLSVQADDLSAGPDPDNEQNVLVHSTGRDAMELRDDLVAAARQLLGDDSSPTVSIESNPIEGDQFLPGVAVWRSQDVLFVSIAEARYEVTVANVRQSLDLYGLFTPIHGLITSEVMASAVHSERLSKLAVDIEDRSLYDMAMRLHLALSAVLRPDQGE